MPSNGSDDLIRRCTDLVVLSVLADGPKYGYAIIKQVAARSDNALRLTPGVLYPLLHRMEKQKLLISSWEAVPADGGGRKRKWYRLSAKGQRRLEQRAAAHRAYLAMIDSFLPGRSAEETP
ncbi:MAG: PadR family transcriptional regulator [Planctomycetota bacterium]